MTTNVSNVVSKTKAKEILAKIDNIGRNDIFPKIAVIGSIVLGLICLLLTLLQTVNYFTFAAYYGKFNKDFKNVGGQDLKFAIPGEIFLLILIVIGAAIVSLLTMVFCSIVVFGSSNKTTAKTLAFWLCVIGNILAITVMIIQSINFGGEMRLVIKNYGPLCAGLEATGSRACYGFTKSFKVLFSTCIFLVVSIFLNLLYTIFVFLVKGGHAAQIDQE